MTIFLKLLLIKNWVLYRYTKQSYAQEGEDLILERIFEGQKTGFYIDVGAHHPLRFSNTFRLYKRGWQGINIDATPGSMEAFRLIRPRDINIEIAVGVRKSRKIFYQFNEPAINTFDKKLVENNRKVGYRVIATPTIEVIPLREIIKKCRVSKVIDLLSIDVEGLDEAVLRSMDWSKKPRVIIVEILNTNLDNIKRHPTYKFVASHGYKLFAKTANTLIFLAR